MSDIKTDDSSKSKELSQNSNRKQVNVKIEPHEETVDHENNEEVANTEFLNTATETENDNKVIHMKEEVTKGEVTGVNDRVNVKCEYVDIAENVYDQELVIDNEGVNKIKSEADNSRISCEITKGVHRRETQVPCKELGVVLEDTGLDNNTQCCSKQFMENAPMSECSQNVIHHIPIKRETQFGNKNIFVSISVDGNIGENLNGIDPGKTSHAVNTRRSEALPRCQELKVDLEDIMLTSSKHNTQDSLVQLTAKSSKENPTVCHPTIKNKNILMDPEKISNIPSVSAGTVDGNISITPNDTETTKIFFCDICNKQFTIKKSLRKHIKNHSAMYSCTCCSFKTRYKSYLKVHINCIHTKSTVFTCDYCSYVTYFKNILKLHINKKHSEGVSNNCIYCSNVTHREDKLSDTTTFNCSHCNLRKNKQHTDIPRDKESVYNCTSCSYKSCEKWNCIRHVNAKHTKTKVFNCSLCCYKAYNKMTLDKHVNVKHTKKNVYSCPHCSYKAYNEYNLKLHVNVMHTKTTVYSCPHCSYKAYNTCTLSKHVSAKHTETVFNCSYCPFETKYQTSLARHINSRHQGSTN